MKKVLFSYVAQVSPYVGDVVEGLTEFMKSSKGFPGPVNLGNPSEISILELAEKILEITGSTSTIIFRDLPQDDPVRRCPDISLAKETLGWEPKVDLDEGLERTVEYFRTILSGTS